MFFNIFDDDAFSLAKLTDALTKVDYKPQMLGQMGIFDTDNLIGTDTVLIEKKDKVLSLVPTSERGAPGVVDGDDKRDIRPFRTRRLKKHDRIEAAQLFKVRQMGSDSELQNVQSVILEKQADIRDDVELTWEHMRLGAVQGIVTYPDGSSVVADNWYTHWGVSQAGEITFNFGATDFDLRSECHAISRAMARASKGAWVDNVTQVHALCGDSFYDTLINDPSVRRTYENWEAAQALREGIAFKAFSFGDIVWHNYRGTDDNSTVAVAADKAKFFPVGARQTFKVVWAPGEKFQDLTSAGQPLYPVLVPDRDREMFVDVELYSYPLYVCLRPEMLRRGTL